MFASETFYFEQRRLKNLTRMPATLTLNDLAILKQSRRISDLYR